MRWSNTSAEITAGASAGVSTSAFASVLKESELQADSMGMAEGPVRIIRNRSEFGKFRSAAVSVAPHTNTLPGPRSYSGPLRFWWAASHAAIVASEYGIPAVMRTSEGASSLPPC